MSKVSTKHDNIEKKVLEFISTLSEEKFAEFIPTLSEVEFERLLFIMLKDRLLTRLNRRRKETGCIPPEIFTVKLYSWLLDGTILEKVSTGFGLETFYCSTTNAFFFKECIDKKPKIRKDRDRIMSFLMTHEAFIKAFCFNEFVKNFVHFI